MTQSFQRTQKSFVEAIKDPQTYRDTDRDNARRMKIYQSLFFNNIDNFVSTGFPVLKSIVLKLYGEKGWESVVRQFFIEHECRSPYFAEISKEFVEYLSTAPSFGLDLPDFIAELAHYEWLELDVSIRKNEEDIEFYTQDHAVNAIRVSPYASLAAYHFEVHLIGEDYIPEQPAQEQQFYVVYRDRDYNVQFAHVNPVTAILVNTLEQSEQGMKIEQLSKSLCQQLPQIPSNVLVNGMNQTLMDMLQKGIFLPVR
ncbi:HvfC family RiPP maturation protein [Alteromonas sp. PRIM-21]|uniref:HvfC family RiPP maturation protein n=1 Tax=Alteromonas sp. PRIM-21 TaxID=1454978 RepID=UPI0022B9924A|nr:putative DNA-binding domain-containing protein [Alteromonas sp. PRIM-21]MCZ8530011.1 putative DNA-binding domain-containing protein [Alteromonas sp. PRIM-21]